jgi:hypothetical protein
MNVVFTGPAFDENGQAIVRADLTYACTCKGGIVVQTGVDARTHLLVASRIDTVKAAKAADRGIVVITYPEFIATYLSNVDIPRNGSSNRYVDAYKAVRAMAAISQEALVAMDVL